jgi:hypothetical protein
LQNMNNDQELNESRSDTRQRHAILKESPPKLLTKAFTRFFQMKFD